MSINLSGRALKRLRLPVVNYYSSAYQVMSAQAGDVNTRYLDVVLYDDRGDIDLSAYSKVYLQVQAYDEIGPQMSEGLIDAERNRAVCRLTSSMLQYTGSKMPCNIWLVGTDENGEPMSLTSQTFYVMVYEGHGGADAEPSEDELTALQSAINDVIELEKDVEEAEAIRQDSFRSVYIKYSFYADGADFTDTWQDGQGYMGVSNSKEEPDNTEGYSWIPLFAAGGSSGGAGGGGTGSPGKNGYSIYPLYGDYTSESVDVYIDDVAFSSDRDLQAGDLLLTTSGLVFKLTVYENDGDTLKMSFFTDIGGCITDEKIQDLDERIKAIEDSLYTAISITSFATTPASFEIGSTVSGLTLNWKTNKTPKELKLTTSAPNTVETLDATSTSKSVTGITAKHDSNVSWSLEATDERGATARKSVAVTFLNGVYYGASAAPDEYDGAFVRGLTKELRSNKKSSFSATADESEYIFYCLPVRMGTCTFTVGGFTGGFTLEKTIAFTNASGYTEDYYVYKSDNANLGATSVIVG